MGQSLRPLAQDQPAIEELEPESESITSHFEVWVLNLELPQIQMEHGLPGF